MPFFLTAVFPLSASELVPSSQTDVSVRVEPLVLPTYEIGPADRNPIFFTNRVYQGAQGQVYPYPMYDILTDNRVEKSYTSLRLENRWLDVIVLPEIGGRILQARDKTNGYDFFYRQPVVKPALIGMIGAWMSGGVEWNIPHHHRASSFMAIDWQTSENQDGSRSITIGETEIRQRMAWSVTLTARPNRSYLEATVTVENRSPLIQSMLYWANVSVACNDQYEVIFAPSVQHGVGHSKTEFVDWPINKGMDLRYWKNHTDQFRSVFAWDFENDFLAGYDHGKQAGTVHVANHHVVGGKKFFLWGNHDRAKMWDKMLTDADPKSNTESGEEYYPPYLELMVGAWSDNQPDYSWIGPGEVRQFKQYWYPIRGIGGVKNATVDAAVNVTRTSDSQVQLGFCVSAQFPNAVVKGYNKDEQVFTKTINIDPGKPFNQQVSVPAGSADTDLRFVLADASGRELVSYQAQKYDPEPEPEPVKPTPAPKDIPDVEQLYQAGLRIEQFHNARLDPMNYYAEALKRDPSDSRTNTAVGLLYARQAQWPLAEQHLTTAIDRMSKGYTVLRDGEPHYLLGYVYHQQGKFRQAKDQYWKAAWTTGYQSSAYFALAQIACCERDYQTAMEMIEKSLETNGRSGKSLVVKAFILRKLGRIQEAQTVIDDVIARFPLDFTARVEQVYINESEAGKITTPLRNVITSHLRGEALIQVQQLLETVSDYRMLGTAETIKPLLEAAKSIPPYSESLTMAYYLADVSSDNTAGTNNTAIANNTVDANSTVDANNTAIANSTVDAADLPVAELNFDFPFRTEELGLFGRAVSARPDDANAWYLLGNLYYYLNQKPAGISSWEKAVELKPDFAQAWRNLGFAYSQAGQRREAIAAYESAVKAFDGDSRYFIELDALYAEENRPAGQRLALFEQHLPTILKHDDAVIRLTQLYNLTGSPDKATEILDTRHFHVWEGGGSVHDVFVDAHLLAGILALNKKDYSSAITHFRTSAEYPDNLEVGRPLGGGQNAKIFYFLAKAYEEAGDGLQDSAVLAKEAYAQAADEINAPGNAASELNYFRILALRKLGRTSEADALLTRWSAAVAAAMKRVNVSDEFSKFGEDGSTEWRNADLMYRNGLVCRARGDETQAKQWFDGALKANPNLVWAKQERF